MFLFNIIDGKIVYKSKEAGTKIDRLLSSYNNTGKLLILDISEYSNNVSVKQMKLYKALVLEIKEYTGMSYGDIERELINNFSPYKYMPDITSGKKTKVKLKVEDMTNKQFSFFIEECVRFANEFFEMNFILE